MADSPLAVRVSDETKELFNQLSESGEFENKADFINRLLTLYQAEQMKGSVSTLKPAIEAVETLLSRLIEILAGVGATITINDDKQKQQLDDQRASFEETRGLLQQRITFMEQERNDNEERAAALLSEMESANKNVSELQQQIRQLESTINDKAALVEEYKAKNDTLNSIVLEYKTAAAENRDLNDSVNSLKQVNNSLQQQIDELTREQQRQAEGFTHEQQLQVDAHKIELENLQASLSLQKETSLLELKQALQVKAEEQQAKHAAAISEYENKVRELLNLLQAERDKSTAPASKKVKKAADVPPSENDGN